MNPTSELRLAVSPPDHFVQFYEREDFLAGAAAEFLGDGLRRGEPLFILARGRRARRFCEALSASGHPVDEALASGAMCIVDAASLLEPLLTDEASLSRLFDEHVRPRVEALCEGGRRPRIYGEVVDLLWREGRRETALSLERLWSELGRRHTFSLMCAYSLGEFGSAAAAEPFRNVCAAHERVVPAESYRARADADEQSRVIASLQQRALALEAEIARREQVEHELRDALKVRDDFLSIAGHELRTPLTALSLRMEVVAHELRAAPASPLVDSLRKSSEATLRQLSRLVRLVEDLLDVTRLTTGRLPFELERVDLAAAVREVAARLEPAAHRASSPLLVSTDGPLWVKADKTRLEQVVSNLVDNAIKYGLRKPIQLRAGRRDGRAFLSVRDQGIGIDPALRDRIFEQYGRGVSDRRYGGLGLGLFITRTVLEALGGSIQVEGAPGEGSTFTVEFPLEQL